MEDKFAQIKALLLSFKDKNPIKIAKNIMHQNFVSMHGPEHHFIDGGSFMVALHSAGVDFNLEECLDKLLKRAQKMPGAMCGYWGVCGSVSSLTAVFSIIHNVGPLSNSAFYADDMEFTSLVLSKMSKIGGPRCCKRNAFISISSAIEFAERKYEIKLEKEEILCEFSNLNQQCLKEKCPFYKA